MLLGAASLEQESQDDGEGQVRNEHQHRVMEAIDEEVPGRDDGDETSCELHKRPS